jgi:hypothetical protein
MTTATVRLPEALQALVDSRLDTIDRILLGRVPRQDRVAIVGEVEAQIYELLSGRDADELSRDDILSVLARLDPPEAYLPDETGGERVSRRVPEVHRPGEFRERGTPGIAKASGVLGAVSLSMIALFVSIYVAAVVTNFNAVAVVAEILFLVCLVTCPVMGLVGLVLGSFARLRDGWAVFGFVAGIVTALASIPGAWMLFR